MANTKTYTGGSKSSSPWREIRIVLTETATSVSNNTSTIAYEVWLDNGNTNFSQVKIGCKVIIDNVTVLDRAYSSSSQYTCGSNASVKIASGTTTVAHNSDGNKSITASTIKATCSSAGIVATQTVTGSGNPWDLTPIARASTISISTNTTVLGQARTITITRASSSFTHTLTYSFGSASGTIATKTSSTSVSFTPPASLAAQLTNAKSGTGTITCETFNGNTSVGTSSISFTGTIPVSTVAANSSTVTMGNTLGFTITRAANNLTHTLTYTFGSATGTIGTSLGTSASWSTPASLAAQVATNNASGSGTVTLTTYNGSATVGTSTASFTLKIPASTFTVSSATVTMGSNQTFTITRAASNLTHKLTYAFGSLSGQSIGTGIGTSKTWTVPTSLAAELSNAKQGTVRVALTTYNGTAQCGSTYVVDPAFTAVAPVSTMTLSSSSVYMGTGSTTVTINRATTNMTHTLEYKFSTDADSAYASIGSNLTTTKVWDSNSGLTYSLASKIPSATSGSWTLRLTTKIGTATVGTSTKTLTLKVPNNSTTQPTLTSSTLSPSSSLSAPFNTIFIANYTKLRAVISASGKYSATISTYAVTVDGVTKSGSSSTQTTTNELTTAGSVTVTTKVTDSRGYTKSSTQTITVYEYNEPSVVPKTGNTKVICGRSNSSGTLQNNGTYVHIEAGRTISTLNSNNKGKLTWQLFDSGGTSLGTGTVVSNQTGGTATNAITTGELVTDLTSTYTVVLTATDDFGNSSTYRATIPSDSVTVHFKRYGNGIGVGMYSQGASRLDVKWASWFENVVFPGLLSSHEASATDLRSFAWICPRYLYSDLGLSSEVSPFTTYLTAWLKQVCADYPGTFGATNINVIGTAHPGVRGFIVCNIYDPTDLSGGLPNYSSGAFYPVGSTEEIRFGTYNYAFSYSVINGNETGSVTYTTNSVITSASNLGITLRKSGKVVTMDFAPTVAAVSTGSSTLKVAQIADSSFYPQNRVALTVPQQASSFYYCGVYVTTGGEIQILKPNTSSTTVRANLSWITA